MSSEDHSLSHDLKELLETQLRETAPNIFAQLGHQFVGFLHYIGGCFLLCTRATLWSFVPPFKWDLLLQQMQRIGVASIPIVFLVSLFTGMVLALQSAYQMQKMSAEIYIATLVSLSIFRELGPVLTALVVAGRVGASMAAELGTMKVTEQIDALEAMAVSPVRYLVVPRYLASLIVLPILTIYADFVGVFGGWLVGVYKLGISSNLYVRMTFDPLVHKDFFTGLSKTILFAMIIAIVGCYEGFRTRGGAEGVGHATTRAVVVSFIMIIAADALATTIFYFVP